MGIAAHRCAALNPNSFRRNGVPVQAHTDVRRVLTAPHALRLLPATCRWRVADPYCFSRRSLT
jgi:hypothetical protein